MRPVTRNVRVKPVTRNVRVKPKSRSLTRNCVNTEPVLMRWNGLRVQPFRVKFRVNALTRKMCERVNAELRVKPFRESVLSC